MAQGDLRFVFSLNHPGKLVPPPQRTPPPTFLLPGELVNLEMPSWHL